MNQSLFNPWALRQRLLLAGLLASAAISTVANAGEIVQPTPLPRAVQVDQNALDTMPPTLLAADFVDRVIHDLPVARHLAQIAVLDPARLDAELNTLPKQLAFWINVYNGYTQHYLKTDPSTYLADRSRHFGLARLQIAGTAVSLEDIEHGVLRRGATIWTLGHWRWLSIRSAFVRRFAVDAVDFRIHFALNCGALSCPPVMPYLVESLDAQLDAMTRFYLAQQVRYDAVADTVAVPALLRWFSADFAGGSANAKRAILRRYGVIPAGANPRITYAPYDWTLKVQNYAAYRAVSGVADGRP